MGTPQIFTYHFIYFIKLLKGGLWPAASFTFFLLYISFRTEISACAFFSSFLAVSYELARAHGDSDVCIHQLRVYLSPFAVSSNAHGGTGVYPSAPCLLIYYAMFGVSALAPI